MTPLELAKLKDEIKKEIIQEIHITKSSNEWSKVKKSMEPRLKHYSQPHLGRIENAIATLTRYTFELSRVANLNEKNTVEAKNFVSEIIDLMMKYSIYIQQEVS